MKFGAPRPEIPEIRNLRVLMKTVAMVPLLAKVGAFPVAVVLDMQDRNESSNTRSDHAVGLSRFGRASPGVFA